MVVARGHASTASSSGPNSAPALMKLGCLSAPTNDVHLKYFARYGVLSLAKVSAHWAGPSSPILLRKECLA